MCKINSINLDYFFLKLDNGVGKKDFIDYFSIIDTFAPTGRYKIMLFPSSLLLNGMHLYTHPKSEQIPDYIRMINNIYQLFFLFYFINEIICLIKVQYIVQSCHLLQLIVFSMG